MAAHMAPGMKRKFASMDWEHIAGRQIWHDTLEEAREMVDLTVETDIQGFDIDENALAASRENARLAGVENLIHFQKRGVDMLSHAKKYGFIITNPPYGERMEEADLPSLYGMLGERFALLDSWSLYMISSYENVERDMKRKADKNRKIYNGMMKTYYYQYIGPKPPARPRTEERG